ncbi:hypothetical protein T484DRAFT_1787048 [Baffinella frigidus]|nr:hypothetical protein T484DRAFT_1787048 [Cryptophyta sp. CCMP2293]
MAFGVLAPNSEIVGILVLLVLFLASALAIPLPSWPSRKPQPAPSPVKNARTPSRTRPSHARSPAAPRSGTRRHGAGEGDEGGKDFVELLEILSLDGVCPSRNQNTSLCLSRVDRLFSS